MSFKPWGLLAAVTEENVEVAIRICFPLPATRWISQSSQLKLFDHFMCYMYSV